MRIVASLSEGERARLTPVLGSVARLVAQLGTVSPAQVALLLLGADLETTPDALAEVQRWVRLLSNLHQAPDEGLRLGTVEALRLRGVPEAAALLATSVVVDAAASLPRPATSQPPFSQPGVGTAGAAPPVAAVESLSFGTLAPGTGGVLTVEVSGGPGRVELGSDHLRVQPVRFGPGATTLRLELLPAAGGALFAELRLVADHGPALALPVVAVWAEEESAGTPAWRDSRPPAVAAAGRTGVETPRSAALRGPIAVGVGELAQALAGAAAGATLRLAAGEHRLGLGVTLAHELTLEGTGQETTSIVTGEGEGVLRYQGSGLLTLRDLTLRWTGPAGVLVNVVQVTTGEALVERCRVTGATSSEHGFGSGLAISGTARATVRDCLATGNGFGIAVEDQAQPTLDSNTCRENKVCGIVYSGAAAGTARANTCVANVEFGIFLADQAQPTLENNTCRENQNTGIAYSGAAAGTARANTCVANVQHGIAVGQQAQPTLENNTCRENQASGIVYSGAAAGTARANTCEANVGFGIFLIEQAQPTLENNTCRENQETGIAYAGAATGTARANACVANVQHGIYVGEQAQPTLENNTCRENQGAGIVYQGTAAGRAERNECSGNGGDGIYVEATARPGLARNRCRDNRGKNVNDKRR